MAVLRCDPVSVWRCELVAELGRELGAVFKCEPLAVLMRILIPGYGYLTLAFVICTALLLGAAVAFAVPAPFIALLRCIAADPSKVVLWGKRSQGRRGGS